MTQNSTFNPAEHLMHLKSKEGTKPYLPVQWRLVWFREQCPEGTIDTEEIVVDLDREVSEEVKVWNDQSRRYETVTKTARGYARFKAIVTDGKGGRATATKSENAASFPDFVEKAETGSIGRALAMLGFGTQFTADELDEQHRVVDTPTTPPQRETSRQQNGTSNHTTQPTQEAPERSQEDTDELNAIMAEVKSLGLATDTPSWHAWKLSVLHYSVANKALKAEEIALLREALEEYKLAGVSGPA